MSIRTKIYINTFITIVLSVLVFYFEGLSTTKALDQFAGSKPDIEYAKLASAITLSYVIIVIMLWLNPIVEFFNSKKKENTQ